MTLPAPARRRALLTAAGAAVAVASLGALMTDLGPWYRALRQPAWKPPDWAFGPGWTIIFGCAALSGYLAWTGAPDRGTRHYLLVLFSMNAFLNVLWSLLFFRLHRPDWALFEVFFFWASIVMLLIHTFRYRRAAAALLVPYLAWVSFAGLLNWANVQLNGPFG
jgi:tryptophan-rich sensory protein